MRAHVLILDNLKANGTLRLAGSEHMLDLPEATIRNLTDRKLIVELDPSDEEPMLFGSSVQPSTFRSADGAIVSLGAIVMAAHARTRLTSREWNALADGEREALIERARTDLGAVPFAETDSIIITRSLDPLPPTIDAGTPQPVSESGTRQGTGSTESLPSVESSAGDASGTNPNTSSDTSSGTGTSGAAGAPAAPEASGTAPESKANKVELPPAGGKSKAVKTAKAKKASK